MKIKNHRAITRSKSNKHSGNNFIEFLIFLSLSALVLYLIFLYQKEINAWLGNIFSQNKESKKNRNLRSFGIPLPEDYSIHGIDISRYQEDIDWEDVSKMEVEGKKISFAFIKATEGDSRKDTYFDYNQQQCRNFGILCGAYHFYRPNLNPENQANHFIRNVNLQKGDLPPVLDIEIAADTNPKLLRKDLKKWLDLMEIHYQMKPIIYTNLNFYKEFLAGYFDEYILWIAFYDKKEPQLKQRWYFWQHSDKGQVNGIAGNVDFNVFKGNLEELKTLTKK